MTNKQMGIGLAIGIVVALIVFVGYNVNIPSTPISVVQTQEAYYPEPTNYAVDTAGVLTTGELEILNQMLKDADTDKHQFAVVIIKSTAPLSIEEYGIKIAEKWKVGYKGLDNGLIVIVATEDRKVRLEVGKGLEGDINDAKAGRLIDEQMIPSLKEGKWFDAISNVLEVTANQVQ
jgi:uncharacterized protein